MSNLERLIKLLVLAIWAGIIIGYAGADDYTAQALVFLGFVYIARKMA